MREVLADLELVSHVPASNYEPKGRSRGGGPEMGGNRPPGDKGATYFARAYGLPFSEPTPKYPGCIHDSQREHVIDNARRELAHLRGHTPRPNPREETAAELDARIVEEGEGFDAEEVAVRFRTGVLRVRKARERAGREPKTGLAVRVERMDTQRRRKETRRLRTEENLPITSIARILGVDKATVSRDLRGA